MCAPKIVNPRTLLAAFREAGLLDPALSDSQALALAQPVLKQLYATARATSCSCAGACSTAAKPVQVLRTEKAPTAG